MLNLTQENFRKIKGLLLREKKVVEKNLRSIKDDDPVLSSRVSESSEPGTDSWMADVHGRATAVRKGLEDFLKGIKKSIENLNSGKYGKCEKCGKQIEPGRLKAMPTATLCISCSKKAP